MVRILKTAVLASALALALGGAPSASKAADWPPVDPRDGRAAVAFTSAWAARLRGVRAFAEVQEAAGARGAIVSLEGSGETSRAVYGWTGADNTGMRAYVYQDGGFAIVVATAGGAIVLNGFGAFVCPGCSSPVAACGSRPSWIPHDLHWDNFDCAHTLTGPQSGSTDYR
jgi:hypothetical protein